MIAVWKRDFFSFCKLLNISNLKKCLKIVVFFLPQMFVSLKKSCTFALAFGPEHIVPVLGAQFRSLTSFHTDKQYNPVFLI